MNQVSSDNIIEYSREMGLTHEDFWRLLPRAMGELQYSCEGDNVTVKLHDGHVHIHLGVLQERRIALLRLPFAEVSFRFEGVTVEQQMAFKTNFDLHFQRGGG